MPQTVANATSASPLSSQQVAALIVSAVRFLARDRGEAVVHKWLGRVDMRAMTQERLTARAADATLLAADLLLSYPSASGATAFDRLARDRTHASAAEQAAIAALCQARFRLLRLESSAHGPAARARDMLSDETLQILDADLPPEIGRAHV